MGGDFLDQTRAAYGGSVARFTEVIGVELSARFETPGDQALLAQFASNLSDRDVVIDAGCGPGRVARFLADQGCRDVQGIDIASEMIDAARAAHSDLSFEVAPLTAMPVNDASVAGVVYWFSIITTPPEELAHVCGELDRVLNAKGRALFAFQTGNGESEQRPNAYGTNTDLTLFRHDPLFIEETLTNAGFTVDSITQRSPQLSHETCDQSVLTCRR